MEDLADAISIRIYSRKLEDTNLRYVSSRLLFHANLISNLQRRYLREIISKVCFFRGIYFPSPLSVSLFVKFIAAGEFFLLLLLPFLPLLLLLPLLWSLNAARLNIPYFHSFVCWKCAFLALPRAFERGSDYYSIDVYDFCKERRRRRDLFAFLAGKKNSVRVKNVWGEVTLLLRSYESDIIFERKRLLFDIIRCLQFS